MKISTRGEYGIRAMVYIATQSIQQDADDCGRQKPVTSREIAAQQGIPEPYLRQILSVLSREGWILSNRGPQGGHSLGHAAEEISLRDILLALEGQTTSIDQILALPCSIEVGPEHCVIREVFLKVKDAVETILVGTTLADLVRRQAEILRHDIRVPADVVESCLPILRD